jgi:hypothetical protein
MSETAAARIDQGRDRLQAAAEPKPEKRTKAPSYHVFRLGTGDEFTHLTSDGPVNASNRKEAIAAVSKASPDTGIIGSPGEPQTFLVIAEKEFQLLTRRVQTKVEEIFE